MQPFPGADANIRRICVRTLLGQLAAPAFRALLFFKRKALGGSLDGLMCGRQCHRCENLKSLTSQHTAYTSA